MPLPVVTMIHTVFPIVNILKKTFCRKIGK